MTKRFKPRSASLKTVTIERLSHDGRGIAQLEDGRVAFVQGGLVGEVVRFKTLQTRNRFEEGTTTEILKAVPGRIIPKCAHFGNCGGCSLQYMDSEQQLLHKQAALLEQLSHFGQTHPEHVLSPLTNSHPWGYRRKARLGVRYLSHEQEVIVGFREKNGHHLTPLQTCEILHPMIGKRLTKIAHFLTQLKGRDHISQMEIAVGDNATALLFRHLLPLSEQDQLLLTEFGQQEHFWIYLQSDHPESSSRLYPAVAEPFLTYSLPQYSLTFQFHPTDFVQVNSEINLKMVDQVLQLLKPEPHETLLDLFCGLGNFTLPSAQLCNQVIGVEVSAGMVERASANAQRNHLLNAFFYQANLYQPPFSIPALDRVFDKLVLNPPRAGVLGLLPAIGKWQAQRIVYVSCNPATLARDAGELKKLNYRLTHVGIVDMFPHTSHIESIACFEKKLC